MSSADLPRRDGPNPRPNRNPDPNRAAQCRGTAGRSAPLDRFVAAGGRNSFVFLLSFGASTDPHLTTLSCLLLTWWWYSSPCTSFGCGLVVEASFWVFHNYEIFCAVSLRISGICRLYSS
ncbi:hypothetical protein C4D60_Mb08t29200 [Musa balbisiana]|uniref:Uncharacterized protein n=1 Tax=Musa balbisiana TaxID=52838 RepID=A0A4S8K7F1_MUSBA|nr:hypothetical protein C4D60_Mb08t29200 [Musa balbisiana]